MKKITLISGFMLCLILGVVAGLNAGWWVYTVTKPASSSCSTPSTGDELNEGFLGTGYENTWTESGSGTIDEDATLPGSPPTACCDEGLHLSDSAAVSNSTWDRGSSISYSTNTDIVIYVYVDAITLDAYSYLIIANWDDDTESWSAGTGTIQIKNDGGTYKWAAVASDVAIADNVTLDTWTKIKLHLDATAASSYIQINDGTQYTFTRNDKNGRYLRLDTYGLGTGESADLYFGYVYVDTP